MRAGRKTAGGRVLLLAAMGCMLLRAGETMDAARAACRLFVMSVLPGLFPYMVLSLMLTSRCGGRMHRAMFLLLGWGGGSPTGARLLPMMVVGRREAVRLAVSCATMSPMFLLGTVGTWLSDPRAGAVCLGAVLIGGYVAGKFAGWMARDGRIAGAESGMQPIPFGQAVEQAARTMLLVCGTMVMLRVAAALIVPMLPEVCALPVMTLLEVTTGTSAIAGMPWPLAWRTALIAGAAGFGGLAGVMQNRSLYPPGMMSLPVQTAWQLMHGGVSFLIALGMMKMLG